MPCDANEYLTSCVHYHADEPLIYLCGEALAGAYTSCDLAPTDVDVACVSADISFDVGHVNDTAHYFASGTCCCPGR